MISKKSIAVVLAGALALSATGVASADVLTAGGVTWNTSSPLELTIQGGGLVESAITGAPQTLTGYGVVANINGQPYCVTAGCGLSFVFSYTSSELVGSQIVFTGGTIDVYYGDSKGTAVPTSLTEAGTGTLWLSLAGAPATFNLADNTTAAGTLLSTVVGTASTPEFGSNGTGWLNATGGIAAPFFETHGVAGADALSDFGLTTNFQINQQCVPGNTGYPGAICSTFPIVGNATLAGTSRVPVPEPSELGLMGLGLGLLGFLFWRRRREASDRA